MSYRPPQFSFGLSENPATAARRLRRLERETQATPRYAPGYYADSYSYEDEDEEDEGFFADDKFHGFMGRGMMPTGGATRFYSWHNDRNGDVYEESYSPSDTFRSFMHGGSMLGGLGFGPLFRSGPTCDGRMGSGPLAMGPSPHSTGSRGPTSQPGNRLGSHRRQTSEAPGPFMDDFWQAETLFRSHHRRRPSFTGPSHGLQPNSAFTDEYEPLPLPSDAGAGPSYDSARVMAGFMQRHTQPVSPDTADGAPNAECPICLDPPSARHHCVKIVGVRGCSHLIGRECLREFLMQRAEEKKECPLCRAKWVPEDGIWQDSEEWQQLAQGHRGGDGAVGGRRGHAGLEAPPLRAANGRQPPDYYRELYPPGYDGRTRGGSSVRAGSFFDVDF